MRSRHPHSFSGSPENAIRYDSLLGFPLPMFINFAVAVPEVLGCGAAAAHNKSAHMAQKSDHGVDHWRRECKQSQNLLYQKHRDCLGSYIPSSAGF